MSDRRLAEHLADAREDRDRQREERRAVNRPTGSADAGRGVEPAPEPGLDWGPEGHPSYDSAI
jgi:hypothetical protein